MIIELVGLPGSGKTTIAEAMRAKGATLVSLPSRRRLLFGAGMFWLCRPIFALKLLWFVVRAPHAIRYELFVNGYLGYAARYRRARFLSRSGALVVLDQGFFQLLISLEGLPPALSKIFPKPDLLVVVMTLPSAREERMVHRGWVAREELSPEKRLVWQHDAEVALHGTLPLVEQSVCIYRYDGSQDPASGTATLMAFANGQRVSARISIMRDVLKTSVAAVAFISAQFFRRTPQVVVSMYHSIDHSGWKLSVTPEAFERQMRYLAKKGWAVPLADIVAYAKGEKKLPAHAVAVTFDDGYRDMLTTVLPILERYHIPATVFVPSDMSARTSPDERPRLNEEELRTLARSPLITIGSHAKTHRKFTELAPEEMKKEARDSAEQLERTLDKRPRFFAYPFGARSEGAESVVKEVGYEAAFGITEGLIRRGDDPFRLKRVQIDGTMNFLLFCFRLTSAVDWNRRIVDALRAMMLV